MQVEQIQIQNPREGQPFQISYAAPTATTYQRLNTSYCNNCGTSGHTFNNCKFPITSIGVIAYRYNAANVLEYLLVRRKDTIGYIEFIRGKYVVNNKTYIQNLLSEMTLTEKNNLLTKDFDTLWYNLWGNCISNHFKSEEKNARDKFDALTSGLATYSLKTLIAASDTAWTEPEWGFPKGRHNNLEKDLSCGLREFEEETGFPTHCVSVIQNILPYEEIFTGSNYKSYKHKYYVGKIQTLQEPQKPFQVSEISKIEWCTYEQALHYIRPYNLEKINVLQKVNTLLGTYNIHF
jgi:8-oxo-dGTP pyrophosphatase MutT (NUDIX family)